MNNGQMFNTIITILRKEARGNILKPERFTSLLQLCHWELYNQEYKKWRDENYNINSLRPFIVTDESVTFAGSSVALSTLSNTFQHAISARLSTGNYTCDVVTPAEWSNWQDDPLMQGISTNPMVMVDGTNINIMPSLTGDIKFSYLKKATNDPYFDYYIDANRQIQYLTEGQSAYTLQTGEVYRDGTSSGDVTSISYDLVWDEPEKAAILNLILQKLGVALKEPDLVKYATEKSEQTK